MPDTHDFLTPQSATTCLPSIEVTPLSNLTISLSDSVFPRYSRSESIDVAIQASNEGISIVLQGPGDSDSSSTCAIDTAETPHDPCSLETIEYPRRQMGSEGDNRHSEVDSIPSIDLPPPPYSE